MEFDEVVKERKSIRKYSDKKPDWRDVIECIEFARYAPMAGNDCTLKFIVVSDKKSIQRIADASQQSFVATAKYIIVVCSDPRKAINSYGKKGEIFVRQQAGAAIENFLLKITEKGLATCWIGYFVEDQIKNELRIPEFAQVEALFPIGYESGAKGEKKPKKDKIDLNNILFFDHYGKKKMVVPRKVDA